MFKPLIVLLWLSMHPVHVTLMSIEYSSEKDGFDTFIQVYYDDFLIDYENVTGVAPRFDFEEGKDKTIALIAKYLKSRIEIDNGEGKLDFKISDLIMSENELKMNLFFKEPGKSKVFSVRNAILANIYKDQTNLLIFKYDKFEEGVKLTADVTNHVFTVKRGDRE